MGVLLFEINLKWEVYVVVHNLAVLLTFSPAHKMNHATICVRLDDRRCIDFENMKKKTVRVIPFNFILVKKNIYSSR